MNRNTQSPGRGGQRQVGAVLLVEDHAVARHTLRRLLEMRGYRVEAAADRREALDMLRQGVEPCLILLDIGMARQAAYRLRRELLRDDRWATIPLVAYSGLYDPRIAAAQLRAAAYIKAPFDVNELLQVVDTHCDREAA